MHPVLFLIPAAALVVAPRLWAGVISMPLLTAIFDVIGILGGMGPEATVDFMAKVIALTDASCDQDHVRMLVDHNPQVPNRQDAILGDGEDPGPVLADMAADLEASGADFLVIPCNTAYVFEDAILAATHIPLISIIGMQFPNVISGSVIRCRPVGVLKMTDESGDDASDEQHDGGA